jgi:hypothetical protein
MASALACLAKSPIPQPCKAFEKSRSLKVQHAFAVILQVRSPCTLAAKTWHPALQKALQMPPTTGHLDRRHIGIGKQNLARWARQARTSLSLLEKLAFLPRAKDRYDTSSRKAITVQLGAEEMNESPSISIDRLRWVLCL